MNKIIMVKLGITMLSVSNPFIASIIFSDLTKNFDRDVQLRAAIRTSLSVMFTLIAIAWFGKQILDIFEIDIPSFKIAGGLIIMAVGFSMIHGQTSKIIDMKNANSINILSIAVTPISIPMIVNPGTMTTLITSMSHYEGIIDKIEVTFILIIISFIIGLILYFSKGINRLLREIGIKVIVSIMGIILVAISIEMIISGIKLSFFFSS